MKSEAMEHQSQSIGFSAWIFIVYGFYYISGYSDQFHNYIIMALFLLWALFACLEDMNSFSKAIVTPSFLFLLLFVLYYFFTGVLKGGLIYTLEYVAVYLFLYGVTVQWRYYQLRNRVREIRLIVIALLVAFGVFAISAILFYLRNPSAARTLAADFYAFNNIAIGGGYPIAFGSAILIVYVFEMWIRREEAFCRKGIFVLMGLSLLIFLLLKTESTTTVIATLLGIVAACMYKIYYGNIGKTSNNRDLRKLITIALLLLVLVLVFMNLQNIGYKLMDMTATNVDNIMARRINRIGQKLYFSETGQTYDNYVDERIGTIKLSWQTFCENPLFGVGHRCGNVFSELERLGVGTHSEIFDTFAQFGLVGGGFWLIFMIVSLKNCTRHSKSKGYLWSLSIMLIFNPFKAFHGYVVLFFLIPAMEYLFEHAGEERNNYGIE